MIYRNNEAKKEQEMSEKQQAKTKHHTPPASVAKAAAHGLELHKKFHKGGTKVGWARARQLRDQKPITIKEINKINSYFARHAVDKSAKDFGNDEDPSKGYIAWLLWGGDAGYEWVKNLKKKSSDEHTQ